MGFRKKKKGYFYNPIPYTFHYSPIPSINSGQAQFRKNRI